MARRSADAPGLVRAVVIARLAPALTRDWRPVLFPAGEVTLFLASSSAVDRPRPDVAQLTPTPVHFRLPLRARLRDLRPLHGHRAPGRDRHPPPAAMGSPWPPLDLRWTAFVIAACCPVRSVVLSTLIIRRSPVGAWAGQLVGAGDSATRLSATRNSSFA
ncbi:hypothetical protein [Saccharothrix deserti]|uniref:hypothetical protein n=1 Tax=Saccharothrix deserti TaxID=2593674 RepID=UPI00131E829B|nr:hypothetical protein [Saccharothrix deserti]